MKRSSVAIHNIEAIIQIYKSHLPRACCDAICDAYERIEKIDNTGVNQDNLFKTERTGWEAHRDDVVRGVCCKIADIFADVRIQPLPKKFTGVDVNLFESWIAKSSDDSFVEPHCHDANNYGCSWAFVFYARLPNETTSLVFYDTLFGQQHRIDAREGDVLIFPSQLYHYTDDVCEGRTILSGNFVASMRDESLNNA